MKTRINLQFLFILSLVFSTTLTYGQFVVSTNADNGPGSFRQAILDADLAPGHNTITFDDNYTINVSSGKIVIHDDLTITGTGIGNTIIDGASNNNLRPLGAIGFSNLEISGITFRNSISNSDAGALGIAHVDNATINNCEFINNRTTGQRGAGALGVTVANLNIENCVFIGNSSLNLITSSGGAVGHDSSGNLTIINTQFEDNYSESGGGALATNSPDDIEITNATFTGNIADGTNGNGGAIYIVGSANSTITNTLINNNKSNLNGGGIWNGSGNMTISKCQINSNEARGDDAVAGGAGIYNRTGSLNIRLNSVITNNYSTGASGAGGGILSASGDVSITNSVVMQNYANSVGGAIGIIAGTLALTNVDIINNNVNGSAGAANPGNGGGIHVRDSSGIITINNSLISGNNAANDGGGIWNANGVQMEISNTIIDNNESFGDLQSNGGGGIFNNGTLNINGSTIANNSARGTSSSGGGIYNGINGEVTISVSTISSNSAINFGGGIFNEGTFFDINASTIAFNSALVNGGGIQSDSSLSLKNTIVAENNATSGLDVSGVLASNDFNLIGTDDLTIFPEKANDKEEATAALGPLRNNGAGIPIHELNFNSDALNAGDPNDLFTDQISQPVFGAIRDIGAFEVQEILLSVDDFSSNGIAVYPNPSKGMAIVNVPDAFGHNVHISVIELGSGKIVESINTTSGLNEINLNRFSNGVYVLNVVSETASSTRRLILAK